MTTENARIKRIHDTKSNILTSGRVVDQQWAFATDTSELITYDDPDYKSIGNVRGWERASTTLSLSTGLNYARTINNQFLSFKTTEKAWTANYNFTQFGNADNYKTGLYQSIIDEESGFSGNGSYYNGTNWKNGGVTGYAWKLGFESNYINIQKSTATTLDATITWNERYKFDRSPIFDVDSFVINGPSGTIFEADNTGVSFGAALGSNPLEIHNLDSSTKIKFTTNSIQNESTDYAYTDTHKLEIRIHEDTGGANLTRYIPIVTIP